MQGGEAERKTGYQMERCAPKRSGGEWTELRGSCCDGPRPRPLEKDRAGLMRLPRRGQLSQSRSSQVHTGQLRRNRRSTKKFKFSIYLLAEKLQPIII